MGPLIVLTCDSRRESPRRPVPGRERPPSPEYFLHRSYVEAVERAGGLVVLLPPGPDPDRTVAWVLAHAAGVVLPGSATDLHPSWYGQDPLFPEAERDDPRADLEIRLARACLAGGRPILGVCGGMQVLAVAAGGSLVQDIPTQVPGSMEHVQPTDPRTTWHPVHLEAGRLRAVYGRAGVEVNSTHHQAVSDAGRLRVTGRAPDGVVEAVEAPDHPFAIGVQWHPELVAPAPYEALLEAARAFSPCR